VQQFIDLLKKVSLGHMNTTAYDTAWIARISDVDSSLSNHALEWISTNQLSDGGWGAKDIYYYHDRVVCTLAAMIALTYRGRRTHDKSQIERGLLALERITSRATQGLATDPNGATVGFEMIVPTLVAEAEKLGIIKQKGDRILGRLKNMRELKMDKLVGLKINRFITPAFSSEMAGTDYVELLDIENLQESNGSVGNSPAATAYFVNFVRKGDEKGISYLRNVIREDGGAPFAAPIDIFERSWVLWNMVLSTSINENLRPYCQPLIDYLYAQWDQDSGVSFSSTYTPHDGDNTSFTYSVLKILGVPVDIQTVLNYEEADCFRCYPLESNTSISVNIHVLDALKHAGFEKSHPSVQKIIIYLKRNRKGNAFWLDKWHTSPFYPTAHAIIAAHTYDVEMCSEAVNWILSKQKADGSWGIFAGISTVEETSYCLQALKIWELSGRHIEKGCLDHAVFWLEKNIQLPSPSLWIGKVLYCPDNVVLSTALSALTLSRQ
jgi:halimadienyl-diphosphate synthase